MKLKKILFSFILMLSLFSLFGCKNKSNEINDEIYEVTEKEFNEAVDLTNVNNFRTEFYTNGKVTQIQERLDDIVRHSDDDINWTYIPRSDITYGKPEDMLFEDYTYNSDKKQYEKFENNILVEILKFKNKKIIYKETHELDNIYVIKLIYGKVNFEVPKEV